LDILLRGFSLSSCTQHSLKVLLLLNPTCLYVLNCEQNFAFSTFRSNYPTPGLIVTRLVRVYSILWSMRRSSKTLFSEFSFQFAHIPSSKSHVNSKQHVLVRNTV
jgi:hypothetical protein